MDVNLESAASAADVLLSIETQIEQTENTLKALKAQKKDAEQTLVMKLADLAEIAGVPIADFSLLNNGYKFAVKSKTFYSVPAANKEHVYDLLINYGYGDIVHREVNYNKLASVMNTICDTNAGELPDEFAANGMKPYIETTISKRKTSNKE